MEKEKGTVWVVYAKKYRMFNSDGEPTYIFTNEKYLTIDISKWTPGLFLAKMKHIGIIYLNYHVLSR